MRALVSKARSLSFALLLAAGLSGLALAEGCSFPKYETLEDPADADGGACGAEACVVCKTGSADCNGLVEDGCETSLSTLSDCGACGSACFNAHGTTGCVTDFDGSTSRCAPACAPGFGDCDLHPDNGCETSLNTDVLNCRMCGNACGPNGGTPVCTGGECGVSSCNPGFGDCSNKGACTFNLSSDPLNCGQCGRVCSSLHGTPRCNAGVCQIDCQAGYGDCNAEVDSNDGCETELNVVDSGGSVPNCGACGAFCLRRAYTTINLEQCALGVCFRDCFDDGAHDCTNNRNDPTCKDKTCGCEYGPCP